MAGITEEIASLRKRGHSRPVIREWLIGRGHQPEAVDSELSNLPEGDSYRKGLLFHLMVIAAVISLIILAPLYFLAYGNSQSLESYPDPYSHEENVSDTGSVGRFVAALESSVSRQDGALYFSLLSVKRKADVCALWDRIRHTFSDLSPDSECSEGMAFFYSEELRKAFHADGRQDYRLSVISEHASGSQLELTLLAEGSRGALRGIQVVLEREGYNFYMASDPLIESSVAEFEV